MHLDGQLNAFARAQAVVTRNPAAGVDLEHMVAEELVSYHAHEGEQVRIEGPPVRLKAKAAETLALAVHELATNAVKYGALSSENGRIAVTWNLDGSDGEVRLKLEWRESGVALDATRPRRKGFGMELLESTLMYRACRQDHARLPPRRAYLHDRSAAHRTHRSCSKPPKGGLFSAGQHLSLMTAQGDAYLATYIIVRRHFPPLRRGG